MIKLGVTGGIGSGKSVVVSFLSAMGIPVYIADDESKRITSLSPVIREKLISCFGEKIFTGDALNKSLFASLIFGNKENLEKANGLEMERSLTKPFKSICTTVLSVRV
ncbi:hypothetical protein FACS1894155_12590 [Bacteroidia bacterium]|nr:hypothetical protein FACS1894155_12590 [Bacteroidia bacterium]